MLNHFIQDTYIHQESLNIFLHYFIYHVLQVPGDGGSQLVAKLNVSHGLKPYCYKHTDLYFPFYLNLELVLPFAINCFVDNFKWVALWAMITVVGNPGFTCIAASIIFVSYIKIESTWNLLSQPTVPIDTWFISYRVCFVFILLLISQHQYLPLSWVKLCHVHTTSLQLVDRVVHVDPCAT